MYPSSYYPSSSYSTHRGIFIAQRLEYWHTTQLKYTAGLVSLYSLLHTRASLPLWQTSVCANELQWGPKPKPWLCVLKDETVCNLHCNTPNHFKWVHITTYIITNMNMIIMNLMKLMSRTEIANKWYHCSQCNVCDDNSHNHDPQYLMWHCVKLLNENSKKTNY